MSSRITEREQEVAGRLVRTVELENEGGARLRVSELGASLVELHLPDRRGEFADVVLGERTPEQALLATSPFLGSTVGRVANRIAGAKTSLGGESLQLEANDPPHHLHGGPQGFDKQFFTLSATTLEPALSVTLKHESVDGFAGYPGTLQAQVRYTLTSENVLRIVMSATTNKTTYVNLAHHSYWNLEGHASGTIDDHRLRLYSERFTPGNPVPQGDTSKVGGAFDFRTEARIGDQLEKIAGGFDHNFIVDGAPHAMRDVATLYAPNSGRLLQLRANQPGVQFYTGNSLRPGHPGKNGACYGPRSGMCLETQAHPNSPNVAAWQRDVILSPDDEYRHEMELRFLVVL